MAREISAVLRCELREGHGDHRGPARQAPGRDTHAHGFCAKAREGVDHWVAPLRARVEGLKSLKQLSEVRLLHPLMLRQALKVVQHVCVHPVISALGLDTIAALHAELQDWKSLLQTRTLWLPALQGDLLQWRKAVKAHRLRLSQRSQHGSTRLQCRWRLPGCCIVHPTFF